VPIPWVQLIKFAPTVISLTREMMQRTAAPNRPADQDARIMELEQNLRRQAEALHTLAVQMRRALLTAVILGAGALLLALAALILILSR
jgi:hypothetical protein